MTDRRSDFIDLLMKQDGLVSYAILITRGRSHFGDEDEKEDLVVWNHKTPVTLKEHKKWLRTDDEYREAVGFIKLHVDDSIERDAFRAMASGNATVIQNVLKTRLGDRGYNKDDNSNLDVGEVYVGFEGEE